MSAAQWRRAMNTRGGAGAAPLQPAPPVDTPALASYAAAPETAALRFIRSHVTARHTIGLIALLLVPFVVTPFITFQVAAQSLALGLIALSLTFLGGYGGMVSLAQMTVAGIAGYATAILCTSSGAASASLGWPWWIGLPSAVLIGVLCATLIGWLSVRTEGIYTIMITLAIGVAFYYLVLQNYSIFNGFQGLREVYPPKVLDIAWRDPLPFYLLCLACSLAGYGLVRHVVRAPFGMAMQGIRDNPRRMAALGFNVVAHRVAAYALAGLLASVGGVLLVWYNGLITPGSVGMSWLINILVIAVLGGMKRPLGAFAGALVFVLLQTFAIDMLGSGARERFNLIIGGVFLAIVLFSPDGLLGLWAMFRSRFARRAVPHHQRRQA